MGIRLNVSAFLVGSGIAVLVLALRAREAAAILPPPPVVEEPLVFVEPIIQPPIPPGPEPVPGEFNVTIPDPLEVALVAVGV